MAIKRKFFLGGSLIGILGLGLFSYSASGTTDYSLSQKNNTIPVHERHSDYVMDVTSKEEVVGNSENVFVAKVIKKQSSIPVSGNPRTQYEVEVLKNIKGELNGTAVVNQAAGYGVDPDGNEYMEMEVGQEFLVEGEVYLFATLYEERMDWHNPVPVYGEVKLESSSNQQTMGLTQDDLITKYEIAFKNQKPSELLLEMNPDTLINGYKEE